MTPRKYLEARALTCSLVLSAKVANPTLFQIHAPSQKNCARRNQFN